MLLDKSATYHPKGGWNMMELGSVYCWIHMTWISGPEVPIHNLECKGTNMGTKLSKKQGW